jgi:catechol 2,3-dioxygenase-like lactoylglutathione lyase family enzyme
MPSLLTPQPARHPEPTVKARRLAYLLWERPDLERAESFLRSFGLAVAARTPDVLYLRGAAAAPYCYLVQRAPRARFVGLALELASREDLQRIACTVPGASQIEALPGPGGGEVVRLTDPSGFRVDAVFGQQAYAPLPLRRAIVQFNTADGHPRIDATQRIAEGAPAVIKLGHVVLELADFQATCAWYTRHFGFIPSDVQVLPDGSPAVAFMRLDLGTEPADHHTLALVQGVVAAYSHSAYELVDADAVGMGQRVLREQGYRHAWGIGRHILGSQIFDYWQDPWGDKHEHYSDGDVFTSAVPTGIHAVSREAMAQWGPPLPRDFTRPKLGPRTLLEIARNLRRSPDLTLAKLRQMARLFG